MVDLERLRRRILIALAVIVALGFASRVWADPFTFLQPGFSQQLYGTAPRSLGDAGFAPDGDVWAPRCGGTTGFVFTRFDRQSTTVINSTTVHPEAPGSPFPSVDACGIANHPNGSLYANTSRGVIRLDANTAAMLAGPFGPGGNLQGIATDPIT